MQNPQNPPNIAVHPAPTNWHEHLRLHVVHALRSFVAYHFAGFVVVSLLGGLILNLVDQLSYVDGLFMATSAICTTGLNVIDLTKLSRGAQAILLVLCILGSTSVVSVLPLFIRSMIIRRRFAADVSPRTKLELSAMLRLIIIVPMYLIVHIVAVFVAGGLYTQFTTNQLVQSTLQEAHVSPWYASAFISITACTDAGFTPFQSSLTGYQRSRFLLILYSYSIIASTTGFPIILRLGLVMRKWASPCFAHGNEEYKYMLEHPRRVYTHLFPTKSTLRLFAILLVLNVMQWVNGMIFDWNRSLAGLPASLKVLNSFFQSVSTRSAGFSTTDLALESPPSKVMQLVMMYLSTLPVALAIRTSTEEAWSPVESTNPPRGLLPILRHTLQRDMIVLVIAYYLISVIERNRIETVTGPPVTLFGILFEIVSAYGTVGLSQSTDAPSLSGFLRPMSRLVLVAVMLFGRHRGLGLLMPVSLDQALPQPGPPVAHAVAAASPPVAQPV